jgi:uncharacterized protein YkwD
VSRRSQNARNKRKIFAALFTAALVAAALLASLPAASAGARKARCGKAHAAPRTLSRRQMRTSILCLVNRVRRHHGLHKLDFNAELRDSATAHSVSMVVHDYFAHEGPGGSVDSRIARAGYLKKARRFKIGEDIGGGAGRRFGSPLGVFEEWMHSPPHRENILDPKFRDLGIGVARGSPFGGHRGAATYTADFGARTD